MITSEIKAKVFAQYLSHFIGTPGSLALIGTIEKLILDKVKVPTRLILRPLSSITDSEVMDCARILLPLPTRITGIVKLANGFEIHDFINDGLIDYISYSRLPASIYQYLQSRGFDLPHYLLDGKTLKESNLCIYTSELNQQPEGDKEK